MATSTQSIFTYNLGGIDSGSQQYVGSVISANPTATAIVLNCNPNNDTYAPCPIQDASYTFGPWAQITPPPNAPVTGTMDLLYTDLEVDTMSILQTTSTSESYVPATISLHCEVSALTRTFCLPKTLAGGVPGATQTPLASSDFAVWPFTVTVTAGLERLAAATSAAGNATATQGGNGTKSGTPTPTPIKNAARGKAIGMGGLVVMGLVAVGMFLQ
ncbi:hypothetical protein ANO11243_051030 [Dothideomycetidae sp. 11243]|nr:hypothetical protein ANO11243_051030 [fungal sp. No.11243]